MNKNFLRILLVFTLLSGSMINPPHAEARWRSTASLRIFWTYSYYFLGTSRAPSPPPESSLSPRGITVTPGSVGSSSVVITWEEPKLGKPAGGYSVELITYVRTVFPDSSSSWTLNRLEVASELNELVVTDLDPSTIYEVMVTSKDKHGTHYADPSKFCSPKFYASDADCILNVAATKGSYESAPSSDIGPSSIIWNTSGKVKKTGNIEVTWDESKNASSYVVQWYGQHSPIDYGEKKVSAGT